MTLPRATCTKPRRIGPGRSLLAALLLLAAGCQAPPAELSGCTPRTHTANRYSVLTRQVLCDTAEEIAHHPLRAGRTVVADEFGWLGSAGRGIFGKRLAMRLHGAPTSLPDCSAPLDPALLETNLQPASVQLYRDGGAALAVLEQMIDSASCRIDVLMYLWEDDPVGWDIAHHLAAWAAPARRVRILLDGGANFTFVSPAATDALAQSSSSPPTERRVTAGEANAVVCWLARQPGIEIVRIRNPFGHFDHRKLVLIDGQAAWAGGRNFSHASFFVRHDVTFTLLGPLVTQLQEGFENYWRDQGGKPAFPATMTPPLAVANAAGRLVENTPTEHSLRRALYHALDHARRTVWMENPYFTDNGVICKLAQARRRGVDTRAVLTSQSDSRSISHANRVTANRLLAAGVRVYLYPGRVHTKSAVVDGCWAYLGSGNFDLLSLRRNHELGVVFAPGPVVQELETTLFQPDFNPDWELHEPLPLNCEDYYFEMLAALLL
jgi:cardiolipin synthase